MNLTFKSKIQENEKKHNWINESSVLSYFSDSFSNLSNITSLLSHDWQSEKPALLWAFLEVMLSTAKKPVEHDVPWQTFITGESDIFISNHGSSATTSMIPEGFPAGISVFAIGNRTWTIKWFLHFEFPNLFYYLFYTFWSNLNMMYKKYLNWFVIFWL